MSYIIYHPDTGTIVSAEDSIVVSSFDLPDDPEEWEVFLAENFVPWVAVDEVIELARAWRKS